LSAKTEELRVIAFHAGDTGSNPVLPLYGYVFYIVGEDRAREQGAGEKRKA
jgi:hypothetical protein